MIYIQIDEQNTVIFQHNMPFDKVQGLGKTKEELEKNGILVDSVPVAELMPGKASLLKFNQARGLYYEYVDIPLSQEELQRQEIENLKAENQSLNTAIVELYEIVLGGI